MKQVPLSCARSTFHIDGDILIRIIIIVELAISKKMKDVVQYVKKFVMLDMIHTLLNVEDFSVIAQHLANVIVNAFQINAKKRINFKCFNHAFNVKTVN
ncbi:MAG: hypothetical protein EZS28_027927 [Streblomastix strix]|uniref:Uncharacterized protein n=1 Tax=Streblomastix strix TaxID=222440 RepID=A0A5J4V3A7_9EUKA|nr:MAG: hypothetical protein EZS28_027927 [Streblomastix strix]